MVLPISQVNETQAIPRVPCDISYCKWSSFCMSLSPDHLQSKLDHTEFKIFNKERDKSIFYNCILVWSCTMALEQSAMLAFTYYTLVQFSGGFSNWFISEAPKLDALFQLDTNCISALNEDHSPKQQCDLLADSDVMGMFCAAAQTKSNLK